MAMEEGTIVIDPLTGVETFVPPAGPNAAKEVYEILKAGTDIPVSVIGPNLAAAREAIALNARAIALLIGHMQDNAVVSTSTSSTVTVTSVTGVTTGAGVSGPGEGTSTGTGTGTIT